MANQIQIMSITGKIENELWNKGIRCHASSMGLCWFTDKPIHKNSKNIGNNLDESYITSLGYKTAEKFLKELRGE